LGVKNFGKHQHYKDRDPVWIKFYVAVLSDPVIPRMTESAQCQLFKFWLLASRHENRIPYTSAKDKGVVKSAIAPTAKLRLAELLAFGMIEIFSTNASKTLDECSQPFVRAREEVEEVRGSEVRTSKNTTTTGEVVWTDGEIALFAALPASKRKSTEALFRGWREGLGMPGGKAADERDISQGLVEYLNNHDTPDFRSAHMVSYVAKARDRRLNIGGGRRPDRAAGWDNVA
jgi:hypothetical protein